MILLDRTRFTDESGRTLMLRGIGVDGACKLPASPEGSPHAGAGSLEHRLASFVGRPFPLEHADEHFRRLREWGFTLIRLMTSWEAVEHGGPGIYDREYLEYLRAIVERAEGHGISVLVDPHQDVWSRFTGGDGAPGWTLEAVGLDMSALEETGAAILPQAHDGTLPRMIWPTNGYKLAAATMFTLFFGGNDFAPATKLYGEPAQEFLQRHYIDSIAKIAEALKAQPNVVGYDTMNEPLAGYIGWRDLTAAGGPLLLGECPSPLQGMALASGIPQAVPVWRIGLAGFTRAGDRLLNPAGKRAWKSGSDCPWRMNGVWDLDAKGRPVALRPDCFALVNGRPVDFTQDYYRPFANRFARALRAADPRAAIFLEAESGRAPPRWTAEDEPGIAFAPHWYDGFTLMRKHFSPFLGADSRTQRLVVGRRRVQRSFGVQLAGLCSLAAERLGGAPTLLGEFGVPFDLDGGRAYRTGDFSAQERALDRSFHAVEENLLSAVLFNYTATNTNARGDGWNGEDLSLFSPDQRTDPSDINSGGRALRAAVRPYPRAVAGEALRMRFDMRRRVFEFEFRHDPAVSAPTEIFVPRLHYPGGYGVHVSDGTFTRLPEAQILQYRHDGGFPIHSVRIIPEGR